MVTRNYKAATVAISSWIFECSFSATKTSDNRVVPKIKAYVIVSESVINEDLVNADGLAIWMRC